MLEIIIIFFVICFVIGLLKAIWDAFKEVILGILGLAIIIAAVVFLGPIILSALPVLWGGLVSLVPIILSALPVILLVLAALFILGCIGSFIEKQKYRSQLKWLEKRGIENISASQVDWSKPAELGYVETTAAGYVISTAFCKRIINKIGRTGTLTQSAFGEYCTQSADQFQMQYIYPLLMFMQKKGMLFPFSTSSSETYYLSEPFVSDCKKLLLTEGAATKDEFTQLCRTSDVTRELHKESNALAIFILNLMLSQSEVEEIELSESGDQLYVAKNQTASSKMTRREVSLD